jgi:hypothetical protein
VRDSRARSSTSISYPPNEWQLELFLCESSGFCDILSTTNLIKIERNQRITGVLRCRTPKSVRAKKSIRMLHRMVGHAFHHWSISHHQHLVHPSAKNFSLPFTVSEHHFPVIPSRDRIILHYTHHRIEQYREESSSSSAPSSIPIQTIERSNQSNSRIVE